MARVFRRHWKAILIQLSLVVMIIGLIVPAIIKTDTAIGQAVTPEAAIELDPAAYTHIQSLRKDLRLTETDLAAIGCSQSDAERVLRVLIGWYQNNESAIKANEMAIREGRNRMRQLRRKMNVGEADSQVHAAYDATQIDLAQHSVARFERMQAAIDVVRAVMTDEQQDLHAAAIENGALPGELRYVPNLSADRQATIMRVVRRADLNVSEVRDRIDQELGAVQKMSCDRVRANVQTCLAGVRRAEATVMPMPDVLRESFE